MGSLTIRGLETLLQSLGLTVPIPAFSAANVVVNPIDIYRCYVADVVKQAVGCGEDIAFNAIQRTQVLAHGDVALIAARLRLKGDNIGQVAAYLSSKLFALPLISCPSSKSVFIPIHFNETILPRLILPYIFDRRHLYGQDRFTGLRDAKNEAAGRKKVIVEFSSPNIAQEFHAGHLRSTIIGAHISNLYGSMGWDVLKINYLGDWGKQFGLLAVGWQKFGSEELFQKEPLKHLLDVYAKINALFNPEKEASKNARENSEDTSEIESKGINAERNAFFKRMEDREPAALRLWKRFRDISIERYISTYARLNIAFDEYSGESTVRPETVEKVERILKEKGIYEENQGSWIIDFKKHGARKLDIAIVRNRGGTSTYLLRDIATVLERAEKYEFDKMIYVVAAEQDTYFQRVFKTVEILGYPEIASKLVHINFGKVQGMTSQLGAVKLLSDILDKCGNCMHEVMRANEAKYAQVEDPETVADIVGITAVVAQDMSGKRINNYTFDVTRMTSFEDDTGPFLQYSHARLCSIMRKAKLTADDVAKADFSLLKEPHAIDILRLVARFPDMTSQAFKTLEPTTVLTYLFRHTHQVSSAYEVVKVLGANVGPEVMLVHLALCEGARQVLENGMRLLGFSPLERCAFFPSVLLILLVANLITHEQEGCDSFAG
ncbi:arginyl-tRNA synthetase [Paracoccidioides lutzii Pb01]|uniref:arginine--tRNA ligase n=1 Tax=Paracoccidioides lutzii (strain ATCC MYA-826 / Pb01) TaxID=502779 RepID=C1H019_PARBA|nr:arginyl-tRNA synthetase [Paracoccidioides lutzii Pb01]EEH33060.2 arginyl-tRNA synthetase [Paracoccidioides lutzii Pb01]